MATLNWLIPGVYLRKDQLNIIDIFNIPDTLKQRGFQEVKESALDITLLTVEANASLDTGSREGQLAAITFLDRFNSKEYRVLIRNMIFNGVKDKTEKLGFEFAATEKNRERYARTVELLLAYQCVRTLKAFSASFGIHISGGPQGSDYDCIANFQNLLFYIDIKSGNVTNVDAEDLKSFLARHSFLHPEASILFLDTQEIPDIVVKRFYGLPINESRKIQRILKLQRGSETVYAVDPNIFVVDISKNGDVLANIRSAIQVFWSYNAAVRSHMYYIIDPEDIGFKGTLLHKG